MKFGILQLNSTIGDPAATLKKILGAINANPSIDLFITPELPLIGYPARDLLSLKTYLCAEQEALAELKAQSQKLGFSILIGHTESNKGRGKTLFNAASLISKGQTLTLIKKSRNPTYDIFDEERFFESYAGPHPEPVAFKDKKLCIAICEDSWDVVASHGIRDMRAYAPASNPFIQAPKADLLINISASPFSEGKQARRQDMFCATAARFGKPLIYANAIGGQDGLLFDGNSFCLAPSGDLQIQAPAFEEGLQVVELNDAGSWTSHVFVPFGAAPTKKMAQPSPTNGWDNLFCALVMGIRDYASKTRHNKALIGLSGGIDSALVATLAAEALGPKNVLGVSLPSKITSDLSKSEARDIATRLGIDFREISIAKMVEDFRQSLGLQESGLPYENLQSRVRGTTLMALSNMSGGLLLATGNKSELAMGYSTLYGDMCGALLPIGDLYKTEVYGLSYWINQKYREQKLPEPIPHETLKRAPTAELAPNQKDTDSLPDYEILDALLFELIENQGELMGDQKDWSALLASKGKSVEQIRRTIALNEFKRYQAPPVLKVHARSFGRGWTMPLAKGGAGL